MAHAATKGSDCCAVGTRASHHDSPANRGTDTEVDMATAAAARVADAGLAAAHAPTAQRRTPPPNLRVVVVMETKSLKYQNFCQVESARRAWKSHSHIAADRSGTAGAEGANGCRSCLLSAAAKGATRVAGRRAHPNFVRREATHAARVVSVVHHNLTNGNGLRKRDGQPGVGL